MALDRAQQGTVPREPWGIPKTKEGFKSEALEDSGEACEVYGSEPGGLCGCVAGPLASEPLTDGSFFGSQGVTQQYIQSLLAEEVHISEES